MTPFQLLMLGAAAYFAFKIYEHIHTLEDKEETSSSQTQEPTQNTFSPFSPEALLEKADEVFEQKEFTKAYALLEEANAKDPKNDEILFKFAYVTQQLGENEKAIELYKQTLELDDKNPFTHNAMASIYRQNKEFTSARIHLKKSLDIDDENPVTYFNYANLLVDMELKEEAINMYEKVLELDPEIEEAKIELEKLKAENE